MQCWCPLVGWKKRYEVTKKIVTHQWDKKQVIMDYFGKEWRWGVHSAMQKDLVRRFIDELQGVLARWNFNRLPEAGLPDSQLMCVSCTVEHSQEMLVLVPPQAACCPLQRAKTHNRGGAAAWAMLRLGFWGLAIRLGPAQLSCGCRFAKGVQCPLTLSLDSTVWYREALHFIRSHGSPLKGDCIPICFIYVILVHDNLCLHLCILAFQDPFWLWKTESVKCNRKYGSLLISVQCISHSFFHKLELMVCLLSNGLCAIFLWNHEHRLL